MEIERKWVVEDWPEGLPLIKTQDMRQGYISVRPTVRIREEALRGGETEYIVCFKSDGLLAREEVEIPVSENDFRRLEGIIGKPLIRKVRRVYRLPDGNELEVNLVDADQPESYMYAEIEYASVDEAENYFPGPELQDYLSNEVTGVPGSSMGAYWERTRLNQGQE